MQIRAITALTLTTVLALVGCGGDEPEPGLSPSPIESPSSTPTAAPTGEPTAFPGEPFGLAIQDATYHVVGVAHDDTLNLRNGPSVDFSVAGELGPTDSAVATGEDLLHEGGLWIELRTPDSSGWANYAYLALPGGTTDITSEIISDNGGVTPSAETMEDLGLLVADFRKSTDPASNVVIVVAPTVGDLGEITVDVIGLGDDSVKGERLVVFGTPDGEGFSLMSVEATVLCDRGVDGDLCV